MPYLTCPECDVRFHSASIRWHQDECPGCGYAVTPPEARASLLAEPIERLSEDLSRESLNGEASGQERERPAS